jgi:ethanolamine transporter
MAAIGTTIVYIIMACMFWGAMASIFKPESELGKQFVEGINAIGPIFFAVAGIFASLPYLEQFCRMAFGQVYASVGADPAMAATTIIAVDMGGYQLADALSSTRESWIMAMLTGYMAGATIVYAMPIGLRVIQKKDKKYFALGMMAGFASIPVGVFVSCAIVALTNPMVREIISTDSELSYQLHMEFGLIIRNLIPLIIICVAIAVGLKLAPNGMIKGFLVFGSFVDIGARLVLVGWILEIYTGLPSKIFGGWGFDPIMADDVTLERCVELVCYVSLMLSGAFPLVYLIQKYLGRGLEKVGRLFNFSREGTVGFIATAANSLAMYPMLKNMRAEDKVKVVAFCVCGSFLIGDHLSFTANFQPSLIVPLMLGKLAGGIFAVLLAVKMAVPQAKKLEQEDKEAESKEPVTAAS